MKTTTYTGSTVRTCDGCGRDHLGPGAEVYEVPAHRLMAASCCVEELAVRFTSLTHRLTQCWAAGALRLANDAMDAGLPPAPPADSSN